MTKIEATLTKSGIEEIDSSELTPIPSEQDIVLGLERPLTGKEAAQAIPDRSTSDIPGLELGGQATYDIAKEKKAAELQADSGYRGAGEYSPDDEKSDVIIRDSTADVNLRRTIDTTAPTDTVPGVIREGGFESPNTVARAESIPSLDSVYKETTTLPESIKTLVTARYLELYKASGINESKFLEVYGQEPQFKALSGGEKAKAYENWKKIKALDIGKKAAREVAEEQRQAGDTAKIGELREKAAEAYDKKIAA